MTNVGIIIGKQICLYVITEIGCLILHQLETNVTGKVILPGAT